MQIVIANDQARNNLFAELNDAEGQPWAEIIFDDQRHHYLVTVFCGEESNWLTFELSDFIASFQQARQELVDRGCPDA